MNYELSAHIQDEMTRRGIPLAGSSPFRPRRRNAPQPRHPAPHGSC